MKKHLKKVLALVFVSITIPGISQNCVQCNSTSATGETASAIGINTTAQERASFAGGLDSEAIGKYSLAFGDSAKAWSRNSIALGKQVSVFGAYSFGVGENVQTTTTSSMVIGSGYDDYNPLVNENNKTLMIGFNSSKSTFFVKGATGEGYTGKIGIGDVTNPQAKLHIKGDEGNGSNAEDADILLEPGSSTKFARVRLGTTGNTIDARGSQDLNFHTASDFVFWDANVGIGAENPQAKLQITDGDIFIEDIDRGIIMKSPDGQCWRGTLDNNGALNFNVIDCNLLTETNNTQTEPSLKVKVFPNPSNGLITVKAVGDYDVLQVRLSDMSGNTILTRELKTGKLKIRKALPAGHYLIEIFSGNGNRIHSEKIVVL